MRVCSILLVTLAAGGCSGNAGFDFIEIHGTLADGTAVNGHNLASTANVPGLTGTLGVVLALGAPFNGPENLAGFRIEFAAGSISAGSAYTSDPVNGPIIFYVANETPDAGSDDQTAYAVNGGIIGIAGTGKKITGTLSNLVLTRDGVTLATIDSGGFQATQP
jgi:hypothetical protein